MNSAAEVERHLPAIKEICQRYGVQELLLFGSARNERFHPDSDIDLLVEFKPEAHPGIMRFLELRDELAKELDRKVDLVPKRGLKAVIRDEVLGSAEQIYAA